MATNVSVKMQSRRYPCGAIAAGRAPLPYSCPTHGLDCTTDDFTAAQKWRFAQQEGELIAAECELAGTDDAKPIFERVRDMRLRLHHADVLVRSWLREADESDADGDYCCGLTRRHDAEQLRTALMKSTATGAESYTGAVAVDPVAEAHHSPSTRDS